MQQRRKAENNKERREEKEARALNLLCSLKTHPRRPSHRHVTFT